METQGGPGTYLDDEGETITDERIHAGDSETHIRFVYDPIETISNGELKFTVAANWDDPQADSSREPGFTDVSSGGSIGSETYSGNSLTVPILLA